ncbi:MAG TPA: DUF1565 domain-containing protein [Hanamia sp.]
MKTQNKILQIKPLLFAMAVFSLGMTLSGSIGKDLYVSPTGSGSNSGMNASPFKTIQKAAYIITPGNTVHVAPGTYIGSLRTITSGTATARIRYGSDKKWEAKIIPTATSGSVWGKERKRSGAVYYEYSLQTFRLA